MSILLSDKSLLELPNEMINQIISFLPKHPIANLLFYHIYYSEEEDGIPFHVRDRVNVQFCLDKEKF